MPFYNAWNIFTEYRRVRVATLKVQHAYRGWKLRIMFIRKRRAAIVIQSHLRGVFAREVAAALREMRRVDEEMRKRERMEEERRLMEDKKALEDSQRYKKITMFVFFSVVYLSWIYTQVVNCNALDGD